MSVRGKDATCLMECGPPDDSIKRKWIVDVDAAFKDLKDLNLLEDPTVCSEQVIVEAVCSEQVMLYC